MHGSLDPKGHEDVSHSQSFAKQSKPFVFAFIRVIRGLKISATNNKLALQPA
jgi:hypothetical protein